MSDHLISQRDFMSREPWPGPHDPWPMVIRDDDGVCRQCGNAGWVIDCDPTKEPITAELIPCPMPDCSSSGRRVELLSVNQAEFTVVSYWTRVPGPRVIMSLGRE